MPLLLLILLPGLTALAILFCRGLRQVRAVALSGVILQFAAACGLSYKYIRERDTGNTAQMLFERDHAWFPSLNIFFHTGVDGISIAMILLTAFIMLAAVLVSWTNDLLAKEYFFLLILLSLGAYGFFISLDMFSLFFFLELAVIPKFLLIGIWGSGRKEYSAMKLALMLMGGSALVLIALLGVYYNTPVRSGHFSFDLLQISQAALPPGIQHVFFPFAFAGFGIFGALFPFHTWVPDGHSSAPTAASMFLAGISMKLGGYGCLRVATYLMPEAAQAYSPIIIILATVAIIYGAFATMMQTDLKYINAYSSVSHCGFVLLGIGMLTKTAIVGAVMQMVSHGLMTALFFAAIGMIYSRTHTRLVAQLGGLLKVMPFIATVFVLAGLCSLGLPGLSGFAAEVTVFMGSWQRPETLYRSATVVACASIVVTAVYILKAVGRTMMGPITDGAYESLGDAHWNEKLAAAVLLAGIVVVGVAPRWLYELVSPATDIIIRKLQMGVATLPR